MQRTPHMTRFVLIPTRTADGRHLILRVAALTPGAWLRRVLLRVLPAVR
jgi:hypothetical protein